MVSKVLVFVLAIGTASAAVARGKLPEKPAHLAHKEGCYIDDIKDVIPFGSTVEPLGNCYSIECYKDSIYYESCGVVGTDDANCYITATNLSKPYPSCCPTVKCVSENKV